MRIMYDVDEDGDTCAGKCSKEFSQERFHGGTRR